MDHTWSLGLSFLWRIVNVEIRLDQWFLNLGFKEPQSFGWMLVSDDGVQSELWEL